MKTGIRQIIGKTVSHVVVATNERAPRQQMFLVFSDGKMLEFWGEHFNCGSGLDRGGVAEAVRHARAGGAKIAEIHPGEELPPGVP